MNHPTSRRALLAGVAGSAVLLPVLGRSRAFGSPAESGNADAFPSQDPAMVREMVGASHAKPDRVRELLRESPRLANATWDWGFGDWETALGAASHVGNREIAEVLLAHGARANLFTHAMLDHLDVVRATITAMPGIERVRGPHGLTLAHHARQGEASAVIDYLKTLPGADIPYTNLPLTPEQQQTYLGKYRLGEEGPKTFEVVVQKNSDSLGIRGGDGSIRRLFNQGDHVFHPAGAEEVRLTFTVESGSATRVQITSPGRPVLGIRAD
jgi:hypothetical protein